MELSSQSGLCSWSPLRPRSVGAGLYTSPSGQVQETKELAMALKRIAVASLVLGAVSALPASAQYAAQPSTKNGEWPHYTADLKGTKYSPLDQINAQNFNKLEVAWRFKTDNLGTRPEFKLEGTPLMIKG